jgi:hypothetical protein
MNLSEPIHLTYAMSTVTMEILDGPKKVVPKKKSLLLLPQ